MLTIVSVQLVSVLAPALHYSVMNHQQFLLSWSLIVLLPQSDWCAFQRAANSRFEEANQRLEEKNILDSILNEKIYDARIRPASSSETNDGPTNIQVNLMIRSIDKIDDVKMEFSTQITFR